MDPNFKCRSMLIAEFWIIKTCKLVMNENWNWMLLLQCFNASIHFTFPFRQISSNDFCKLILKLPILIGLCLFLSFTFSHPDSMRDGRNGQRVQFSSNAWRPYSISAAVTMTITSTLVATLLSMQSTTTSMLWYQI